MKKWTIPLAGALAVALAAMAHATFGSGDTAGHAHLLRWFHGAGGHEAKINAHLDAMAMELELTVPQRKAVAAALVAALPELDTKALALIEAHAKQVELVHSAELDEAALGIASTRVGLAQGELVLDIARTLREVHRVLRPDQLDRVARTHRPDLLGLVTQHVRGVTQGLRAWADRQ